MSTEDWVAFKALLLEEGLLTDIWKFKGHCADIRVSAIGLLGEYDVLSTDEDLLHLRRIDSYEGRRAQELVEKLLY